MKRNILRICMSMTAFFYLLLVGKPLTAQTSPWVTTYFAEYQRDWLPAKDVDFSAMTDVVDFAVVPDSNGTLDTASNSMSYAVAESLITLGHSVGTKVLVCVGGYGTEGYFLSATGSSFFTTFVNNIVSFVKERGYDGVDLDWEVLQSPSDSAQFASLVVALRDSLPRPYVLTSTAMNWTGTASILSSIQTYLDQINIMTYDLSGPWTGWVTWYNGSLHTWGTAATNYNEAYANCDSLVDLFLEAGVPAGKLGIGSEFGGTVWNGGVTTNGTGVTGPNQSWTTTPSDTPDTWLYNSSGTGIMQQYYSPQAYRCDTLAQASYLSIVGASNSQDYFISYDDTNDINAKFNYIKQRGLGGIIVFALAQGYPGTGTFPLLSLIKRDRLNGTTGGQSGSGLYVYQDSLLSPWMDVSYNATVNYQDSSVTYQGDKYSIQVINSAWGALSVHYGQWSSGMSVNSSLYSSVRLYLFTDSSATFDMELENDQGDTFPLYTYGNVQVNQWDTISVPMSQLDPNGYPFQRIDLMEESGMQKTYYVDDYLLVSPQGKAMKLGPALEYSTNLPKKFRLEQNYPNPFNPTTTIDFTLPKDSYVHLTVYNILGQRVATLADGTFKAGDHQVVFSGDRLASGVYLYIMRAGNLIFKNKMLLLK